MIKENIFLNDAICENAQPLPNGETARYNAGGGTHLEVKADHSKRWVWIGYIGRSKVYAVIGNYPQIKIAEAQEKGREFSASCERVADAVHKTRAEARKRAIAQSFSAPTPSLWDRIFSAIKELFKPSSGLPKIEAPALESEPLLLSLNKVSEEPVKPAWIVPTGSRQRIYPKNRKAFNKRLPESVFIDAKPKEQAHVISDGYGLSMTIQPSGKKTWYFRFIDNGKQARKKIGDFETMTLAQARAKVARFRKLLADGIIPHSLA